MVDTTYWRAQLRQLVLLLLVGGARGRLGAAASLPALLGAEPATVAVEAFCVLVQFSSAYSEPSPVAVEAFCVLVHFSSAY